MTKKRKVYDDIELLEVSPVGIPSYPDAINHSLIKSLKSKMVEEENTSETQEVEEEVEPEKETEKSDEKSEEVSEKGSVVQMTKDNLSELISGIVKEIQIDQKGLVENKKEVDEEEELSKKSIGELAIHYGLFDKNQR